MAKTILTIALMDPPYESENLTTAFRILDVAARRGYHLNVFAYEGAAGLAFVRQTPHPNPVHGKTVAEENHPTTKDQVAWVSYPGLEGDRNHALQQRYSPRGAGSVFTFGLKGGYEAGVKLVEGVELFSHLANLGDTKSLIIHPASTTHRQLSEAQKVAAGAGPDVVRLSVGIETVDDIIADLAQALAKV